MTYRNDPNRTKTVLSPAEVKAMLGGGDPAADRPQNLLERPSGDDKLIAAVLGEAEQYAGDRWSTRKRRMVSAVAGMDKRLRCPDCGRAFDCACGDECEFCVDGTPRQAKRKARRYAPASR